MTPGKFRMHSPEAQQLLEETRPRNEDQKRRRLRAAMERFWSSDKGAQERAARRKIGEEKARGNNGNLS